MSRAPRSRAALMRLSRMRGPSSLAGFLPQHTMTSACSMSKSIWRVARPNVVWGTIVLADRLQIDEHEVSLGDPKRPAKASAPFCRRATGVPRMPRPKYVANARAPWASTTPRMSSAARSSASSQVAWRSLPSPRFPSRIIGCRMRSFPYSATAVRAARGHTRPRGESLSARTLAMRPSSMSTSTSQAPWHSPQMTFLRITTLLSDGPSFFA